MPVVFTIGHSNHPLERFLALLAGHGVEMVVDVRSTPASRRLPHYGKRELEQALHAAGLTYLWQGRELGGRPADAALYSDGVADYERMAEAPAFRAALARVLTDAAWLRLCLMCAEKEPLDCHRCLLVGRALQGAGAEVRHILPDSGLIGQDEIERQLLADGDDLFQFQSASHEEQIAGAYRARARKLAFKRD